MPECLFCEIAAGRLPAAQVLATDRVVAFRDIDPQAPVHVLVVPTDHADHLSDFTGKAADEVAAHLLRTASEIGSQLGPGGYRVVMNQGHDGGQTVHHLHAHVLAGRPMTWPPG